jgi:hypothetical protein
MAVEAVVGEVEAVVGEVEAGTGEAETAGEVGRSAAGQGAPPGVRGRPRRMPPPAVSRIPSPGACSGDEDGDIEVGAGASAGAVSRIPSL